MALFVRSCYKPFFSTDGSELTLEFCRYVLKVDRAKFFSQENFNEFFEFDNGFAVHKVNISKTQKEYPSILNQSFNFFGVFFKIEESDWANEGV